MTPAARMSRLGTESAFEVLARANSLAAQGRDIINLGIGQPDFPTPANIVEAGRKAYLAGRIARKAYASASSPTEGVAKPRRREPVS